ncbi:MAG: hypothetical protein Q8P41_16455 [Pseudomonadota bacterium]|nr:hypothetical protein [Pseudomonadota bacterium]
MIAVIHALIDHLAWLVTALAAGGLLAKEVIERLDRADSRTPVVLRPGTRQLVGAGYGSTLLALIVAGAAVVATENESKTQP